MADLSVPSGPPAPCPPAPCPPARRDAVVEDILGHRVEDPYRWLESRGSDDEVAFSEGHDRRFATWSARWLVRPALVDTLVGMAPGHRGAPLRYGRRLFWTEQAPGVDHAVVVVEEAETVEGTVEGTGAGTGERTGAGTGDGRGEGGRGRRVVVDPNAIPPDGADAPDGTVTLDGWAPSLEGDRLAYLLSSGGDEESSLWVLDVATGAIIDGPIDRTRYSPISWLPGGEELFYVRRLPPEEVAPGEEAYHRRVWRHRIGAAPETDELVFGAPGRGPVVEKTAYLGVDVAPDGRWLAVSVALGTAPRNDLYVARLAEPAQGSSDNAAPDPAAPAPAAPDPAAPDRDGPGVEDPGPSWQPVLVGVDAQAWPVWDQRGDLWLLTDLRAPRRRVARVDPSRPAPEHWDEVLAESSTGAVLESFVLAGERMVALYARHGLAEISVHGRLRGELLSEVALPGPCSAAISGQPEETDDVWVATTGYAEPPTVSPLDLDRGDLGPALPVPPAQAAPAPAPAPAPVGAVPALGPHGRVVTSVVEVDSADGTLVRMTVIAPEARPSRPRPAVLYGYGGFGVSLTPAYSAAILAWVAAGGVWVVANLRGGGEEGESWHRGGMRQHKERVFEDFEALADALVAGGWTTTDQLGIFGGSNGGLLVGAALTRSPRRYAAVVCSAPLLDMVRYERFGLGATWADEYGTASDPEELGWLLSYSPYHAVRPSTAYPATLFTVFDGDTRVDPLHARKMAAALAWAGAGAAGAGPVLVRREAEVGHGARSLRRTAELGADELAFLGEMLGLDLEVVTRRGGPGAPGSGGGGARDDMLFRPCPVP